MNLPKIEIRIPISPKPVLFQRVKLLCRSLAACGGVAATARVVVSVGGDCEPYDLEAAEPWSRGLVHWRWVDREAFRRDGFLANGLDRFFPETEADVVLFLDNDVVFTHGVDDLLEVIGHTPVIAGVMAHIPPFPPSPIDWPTVFDWAGLRWPQDVYLYSGWGLMFDAHLPSFRLAPAYFNFGAVYVPGTWLPKVAKTFRDILSSAIRSPIDTGLFNGQIALTLAIYRLELPRMVLGLRYNYPNDPRFDAAYANDLGDVRMLHYLRTDFVHRDRDLESPESIARLVSRTDLTGSNEVFRQTVARLCPDHDL